MVEVICSGLNVVDLLVKVPNNIPKGHKTACDKILVQGGAPAGNAACGLASLGHKTAFLGYFDDNPLSAISKSELQKHGVLNTLFINKENASPAIAIVQIDDEGERTVLYSMENYLPFSQEDVDKAVVASAKLLLLDGYAIEINTYLLQLARKHGLKSVLDLERTDEQAMKEMVSLATDAILPLDAGQALSSKESAEACLLELAKLTKAQLVITDGSNGAFALESGSVIHQPAFEVEVVDTTGCGDAFHAAYASALLQGMDLPQRLEYASFFAAQVATRFGGRAFLPNREFMNKNCPVFSKA